MSVFKNAAPAAAPSNAVQQPLQIGKMYGQQELTAEMARLLADANENDTNLITPMAGFANALKRGWGGYETGRRQASAEELKAAQIAALQGQASNPTEQALLAADPSAFTAQLGQRAASERTQAQQAARAAEMMSSIPDELKKDPLFASMIKLDPEKAITYATAKQQQAAQRQQALQDEQRQRTEGLSDFKDKEQFKSNLTMTEKATEEAAKAGQLKTSAQSKQQLEYAGGQQLLSNLDAIEKAFDPSFLTTGGQVYTGLQQGLDRLGAKNVPLVGGMLTPDADRISKSGTFSTLVGQTFQDYRKLITGAAASNQELNRLEQDFINMNIGPEEFKAKFAVVRAKTKRAQAIRKQLLTEGITDQSQFDAEFGRRFEAENNTLSPPTTGQGAPQAGDAPQVSAPEAQTNGSEPVQVKTPADVANLPSGTIFVTPDGRRKVKP